MGAEKEHLLLLVHRIPFPPNKGDKIRSYHLLKHLATRYHVHLGCFIDDPNDWQYVETVKQWCGETKFVALNSTLGKLRSLPALLSSRPLSLDFYRSSALQKWVDDLIARHHIKKVVLYSSVMAQFIEQSIPQSSIVDFVDIDSDKWSQYAAKKSWPMSWVYGREGRTLLAYEKHISHITHASLFVSETEAALFKRLNPDDERKIGFYNNGVDSDYFSPEHPLANPYSDDEDAIVFTGAMDYWPNVDAVQCFAQEVFPGILRQHPRAVFYVVGTRPTDQVKALAQLNKVKVTGAVPDVRPYLAHAKVSVAPLRIARGIQNKVLEAMSMAKAVVVSPQALEGIEAVVGQELLLATSPQEFVEQILPLLLQARPDIEQAARRCVEAGYNWSAHLQRVDQLLEQI